jgi:hypothetical protein
MTDYKILGQSAPSNLIFEDVYSTPTNKTALIRAINVINNSSNSSDKINIGTKENTGVQQRELFIRRGLNGIDTQISKDGIIWETKLKFINGQTGFFTSYAGNFGQDVLLNNFSYIAKSQDLINWTGCTIPFFLSIGGVGAIVASSERVVVSGNYGAYATSTDLITWESSSEKIGFLAQGGSSILYNDGKFVSVGGSGPIASTSTDGITWTFYTVGSLSYRDYSRGSAIYGGGTLLLVPGYTADVISSTDAITWTISSTLVTNSKRYASAAHGNGIFLVGYENSSTQASTSTDGITWTVNSSFYNYYSSLFGGVSGIKSISFGSGKFVVIPDTYGATIFPYSTDAITWNHSTLPASTNWIKIISDGTNFFALAQDGSGAYSTDGITWTARSFPEAFASSTLSYSRINYVNNKYIVTGYFGSYIPKAYTSTDAITWTENTAKFFSTHPTASIAYDGVSQFMALGNGSNLPFRSTDLISFDGPYVTPRMGNNTTTSILEYGNGLFVALDRDTYNFAYSTDGVLWTASTLPAAPVGDFYAGKVIYKNSKFVAIGTSQFSYISTDGITWSPNTMSSVSVTWRDIAYGNNAFICTKATQDGVYSTDGITWTPMTFPTGNWYDVAYGDNRFIAVGLPVGGITSNAQGISAYSTDGITWTLNEIIDTHYRGEIKNIQASYTNMVTQNDLFFANYEILPNETVTIKGGHIVEEGHDLVFMSKNGTTTFHAFGGEI